MAYTDDQLPSGLENISATEATDNFVFGDASDSGRAKKITRAQLVTDLEQYFNHDNLTGFVANEHIDHSSVTLTAGDGLTGGGTIAASRSFAVDINGATDLPAPSGVDEILVADIDDNNNVKKTDLATAVDNAGALLKTATDLSTTTFFLDEDTMSSDSATKVASQQSIKAFVEASTANIQDSESDETSTTVTNTTTETTIYTFSIPANALGANGVCEFFVSISDFDIRSSVFDQCTITVDLGATQVGVVSVLQDTSTTLANLKGFIRGSIVNASSTSAQRSNTEVMLGTGSSAAFSLSTIANTFVYGSDKGSSTEDTTGALTVNVRAQWNAASTGNSITADHGYFKIFKG